MCDTSIIYHPSSPSPSSLPHLHPSHPFLPPLLPFPLPSTPASPLIKSIKLSSLTLSPSPSPSPSPTSPSSPASISHPRPNFSLKALNRPASSCSWFRSDESDGFQSGELRVSFVVRKIGAGDVVRSVNVEPSVRDITVGDVSLCRG